MWEQLRKSINGIINKVNVSNISNIIVELFSENLMRGKGLLARAIMKAQMASPTFTQVYAALLAAVNTKLPDVVRLVIHRVVSSFKKAYRRNSKLQCKAACQMIAHLVNQQVVHELLALQVLALFLEHASEDSIEMAADFMVQCGQVLAETTPAGVNAIFERFRTILHEGKIQRRVQYTIEKLFTVRKNRFKDNVGVIQELDLIEEQDKITHEVSLDDDLELEESLDFFKFDPDYERKEAEWDEIKKEILGEYAEVMLKTQGQEDEEQAPDLETGAAGVPIDTNAINYQKVSFQVLCRCRSLIFRLFSCYRKSKTSLRKT